MKSIILAGGSGTRLWPLSRTAYPKQFVKFPGMEHSLFQMVYTRCLGMSKPEEIYIVSNVAYESLISTQIEELGIKVHPNTILLEPIAKNTLPAIYYGVKEIQKGGEDTIAVFASDHLIGNPEYFISEIQKAIPQTQNHIITFGITPTHPETAYGYIQQGKALANGTYSVDQFKEKPDLELAREYVEHGYLWNSGMFMFRSDLFTEQVKLHAPGVYEAFASDNIEEAFQNTPRISIDYGILEKADCVAVLPLQIEWNDLGSFTAFDGEYDSYRDERENIHFHNDHFVDSSNNLVYSNAKKVTALVGVEDLIIVDQPDALLVCAKYAAQEVKHIVDALQKKQDSRSDYSTVQYHPWGTQETLSSDSFWIFQQITFVSNKILVYQKSDDSSEQWTVVHGSASFEWNGQPSLLKEKASLQLDQIGICTVTNIEPGTKILVLRMHPEAIKIESKDE